jgi:hypothetical protein
MVREPAGDKSGSLQDVIPVGLDLPGDIFARRFKKYLFFDADINSSQPLILAMQQASTACFGLDLEIDVYTSFGRTLLKRLKAPSDWAHEITRLGDRLFEDGDMGGMILVDRQRRWVAYQARPVDVGVFAIDCLLDLQSIEGVRDGFFSIDDIKGWLLQLTQRDRDLVDGFGKDYLTALVANYS